MPLEQNINLTKTVQCMKCKCTFAIDLYNTHLKCPCGCQNNYHYYGTINKKFY